MLSLVLKLAFVISFAKGQCYIRPFPCELTCRCGASPGVCLPEVIHGCGEYGCQSGWRGPTCQKENLGHGAQSSRLESTDGSSPKHAFDGDLTTLFQSIEASSPYLQLDLLSKREIYSMRIYNRQYHPAVTSGFHVYVSNSTDFINSKLCYQDTSAVGKTEYIFNCTQHIIGEHIRLTIPKTTNLHIRELEIYSCGNYWFGDACGRICNCEYARDLCNGTTGHCSNGCPAGFTGIDCYTECDIGWFGLGCRKVCHCKNQPSCNKIDGTCDQQGCAPGYTGHSCQTECMLGYFGHGCTEQCNCKNQASCNIVNGTCDEQGCAPGYKGETCQNQCDIGWFGLGCQKVCHCKNQPSCDKIYGTCDQQGCAPGYTGHSCQTGIPITGSSNAISRDLLTSVIMLAVGILAVSSTVC